MREIELKFAVEAQAAARIAASRPLAGLRPDRRPVTTWYFDTPQCELRARGLVLRLRRDGTRWVQSLKAGRGGRGGLHVREEWEFGRDTPGLELALFADTPLAQVPDAERLHERLRIAFEVDLVRTAWLVQPSPRDRLEVVLDEGRVRCGARAKAIREVEIECLEGDAAAAFDLAAALLAEAPMRPSAVTKSERGYRLFTGEAPAPVKARPVPLPATATPIGAAREIVGAALEELQANEEGVLASRDPEFVHQARVCLRRIRSALRIFGAAIGPARASAWRGELGELAQALGRARDWDVLAGETLPPVLAAHGDRRLARRLLGQAERHRARERAAARRALAAPRYARVVLELARWLARAEAAPRADCGPLGPFAARVIGRRHRRVLAHGARLARLDAQGRHRLRIRTKRLRYAIDGLASVFESGRTARYREALVDLQDALGEANDAATALRLLPALDPPRELLRFARRRLGARARGDRPRLQGALRRLARRGPPGTRMPAAR